LATRGLFATRWDAAALWRVYRTNLENVVIVGETRARVQPAAERLPGVRILNDMPDFSALGLEDEEVTSRMMSFNRKWLLDQLQSGKTILDIGHDPNRVRPSIFYQMERNMLPGYKRLHPDCGRWISR
jgi:hypothetical protein